MSTEALYRTEPYLRSAETGVASVTPEGIVPERSILYPRGGGQPGDTGWLEWNGGRCAIAEAVHGEGGAITLLPVPGEPLPPAGATIRMELDWDVRHRHMRMHTALHLLSVVVPLPVTGGQIGAEKSRLDFEMPEVTHGREAVEEALAGLVAADHPVTEEWITEEELDADPGLVKTLSVRPPRGAGRIRLIRIGSPLATVDLQPCGGTHVRSTAEIGRIRVGKIENKGRSNRRIPITLEP